MQNKFKNINLILDKIEIINDEKFSSDKFNGLNYSLETEINIIKSLIDEKKIDSQTKNPSL